MTPLDVITLAQAKLFLKADFPDDDSLITEIIAAAVNYVEQQTQYRLYQRMETEHSDGRYNVDLFQDPINSISVQTIDGTPVTWPDIFKDPVRTKVIFQRSAFNNAWESTKGFGDGLDNCVGCFYNWGSSLPLYNIIMNVGYDSVDKIPSQILQSVKTVIVNMYENRNTDPISLPSNVSDQLVSFNRSPMF